MSIFSHCSENFLIGIRMFEKKHRTKKGIPTEHTPYLNFIYNETGRRLVHLSQRVSVFHFSLNHKEDFFRIVFPYFILFGFFYNISHNLFQIDVDIAVFIGLSVENTTSE